MGVILSIEWVEKWDKDGILHKRTHAIVKSSRFGNVEVTGYGSDYAVGDKVQVLYDEKWDKAKMQKSKHVENSK